MKFTGNGEDVAFGFLEKALGHIFNCVDEHASKIPNNKRSVTLYKNIEDPFRNCDAACFICAGSPKIPRPRHSCIVWLLHPNIKPGNGAVGHMTSSVDGGLYSSSVFCCFTVVSLSLAAWASVVGSYRLTRGEFQRACTYFERSGAAQQWGIKTVVGIPITSPNVGRVVVVFFSRHDRPKDQELVSRISKELSALTIWDRDRCRM